jgi:hypothetical protein
MHKDTLIFLQEMKQFFIKKGKKETMENYFRSFLIQRALSKKVNFYGVLSLWLWRIYYPRTEDY